MKREIAFGVGVALLMTLGLGGCSSDKKERKQALEQLQSYVAEGAFVQAITLADSIDSVWASDLALREEALAWRRKALSQKYTFLLDSIEQALEGLQVRLDSLEEKMVFIPESETQEAKYCAQNHRQVPTQMGNYLYASAHPKGFLSLTHYYIGSRPLKYDAIGLTSSQEVAVRSRVFDTGDDHNHTFTAGGRHHATLQLPPNDSYALGLYVYMCYQDSVPLRVELHHEGKVVTRYTLSRADQKPLAETFLFAQWVQQRESLKARYTRYQKALGQVTEKDPLAPRS